MSKIRDLPPLAPEEIDGSELCPVSKDGTTRRASIEYLGRAAALTASQARDLAVAAGVQYPSEAAAVAALADGAFGSYLDGSGNPIWGQRTGSTMTPLPGPWLGGDKVSFVQPSIAAVPRNVTERMRETISAFDFGVSPSNSAGTNAINLQSAVGFVAATGGGEIELPRGPIPLASIDLPQDVLVTGKGRFNTLLVAPTGFDKPIIQRIGTFSGVINRGGVRDLAIVGSGRGNVGMVGIKNVFTNRGVFENIDIFGCREGMWIENVWQDKLDHVHVHGGGTDQSYIGFYFAPKDPTIGVSNAVIATGCMAQGVEYCGFRIVNGNGSKFASCEASDGHHAFFIGAPPTADGVIAEFLHFTNCLGDTTSDDIWRFELGNAAAVRRMQMTGCWAGNSSGGAGVAVRGCSELMFSNMLNVSVEGHGFEFTESARCVVTGSNVREYNRSGGAFNGFHINNSAANRVLGCEVWTPISGTGKSFVEVGASDHNLALGNNLSGGFTLVGANSVQANNGAV